MQILSGSSNIPLASAIAKAKNLKIINREIASFSDGETKLRILDETLDTVTLIQTISPPVDYHIVETLLLLDSLTTLGVKKIILVVPWMGYSIQNRSFRTGEPISARAVARLFNHRTIQKIILLDLHKSNILPFFKRPTIEMTAVDLFIQYVRQVISTTDLCIVSPDEGSAHMGKRIADTFSLEHIIVQKKRDLQTGETKVVGATGTSKSKAAIIVDDGVLSGGTIKHSVEFLNQNGVTNIHCMTTHAILTPGSIEKIDALNLQSFICTDSIYHTHYPKNTVVLSIAEKIAEKLITDN